MIGRTLGIGMALGLSLGSAAWADDSPVVRSDGVVVAMPSHKDDSASAQRRRRARRAEAADADSPYGEDSERGNQNGNESPDQSAATGSDDPRTASSGGNAGTGSSGGSGEGGGGEAAGGLQRSDHLDFDDRLIQGQTARAGAVYLFSRPPRDLPELVKLRRSFRTEISRTVLARDPITPAATTPTTPATPARGAATTPARGAATARNANGQRTPEAGTPPEGENNGSTTRPEGREGREGRTGRRRGGPRNP